MNSYSQRPEQNPFFGKIICGECNLAEPIESVDTDFILKVLDYIKVYESGKIEVKFLDGSMENLGA